MKTIYLITSILFLVILCGILVLNYSKDSNAPLTDRVTKTTQPENLDITNKNELVLSNQQLSEAPSYIFSQQNLTHLDLSNNNLTGAIQAEIRFLSNLKYLDLSNNQLTGVPAEIGQLNQLEELNLSNNNLTGLPHELGQLTNLKLLDLRGNEPSDYDLKIIRESLVNTVFLLD